MELKGNWKKVERATGRIQINVSGVPQKKTEIRKVSAAMESPQSINSDPALKTLTPLK